MNEIPRNHPERNHDKALEPFYDGFAGLVQRGEMFKQIDSLTENQILNVDLPFLEQNYHKLKSKGLTDEFLMELMIQGVLKEVLGETIK